MTDFSLLTTQIAKNAYTFIYLNYFYISRYNSAKYQAYIHIIKKCKEFEPETIKQNNFSENLTFFFNQAIIPCKFRKLS